MKYLDIDHFLPEIKTKNIFHEINTYADEYMNSSLENKLILAIAIRYQAEEFMINKINNIVDYIPLCMQI